MNGPHTLVAGIGSPHGDDQVGWLAADLLLGRVSSGIDVRRAATPGQLLDWLGDVDRLLICDAWQLADAHLPAPPYQRWNWPTPLIARVRSAGSHSFGLPQVLELAGRLGSLPERVVVFGLAGMQFDAFAEVSPQVQAKLPEMVAAIARELCGGLLAESSAHA